MVRRYFFHATDGDRLEIDRAGRRLTGDASATAAAAQVARATVQRFGPGLDWSDWIVAVYDDAGRQMDVLPFAELHEPRRLAA